METKYFYVRAEIGEGVPCYDFVLRAKAFTTAEKIAEKIIKHDYPDYVSDFSLQEITAEKLLERMLLN